MTAVGIAGEDFLLDGAPTYAGRAFDGHRVEGLLFNARMVQALFDDRNPETRGRWAYPDTGVWDPERNVREFLAMLPEYRRHGLPARFVQLAAPDNPDSASACPRDRSSSPSVEETAP